MESPQPACPGTSGPRRNADEIPAGRVMLQVGEDVEGGSSTRRTWGQQYIGNRGRAGDTERGAEVNVCKVPHFET